MTLDERAATTSFPASTAPAPPDAIFAPYDRSEFDRYVQNTYVRYPMTLVAGKGSTVWDDHGRAYVDCVAGIATCSLGHADARLLRAVTDQLSRLHHVSNLYYTREQGELAKWIVTRSCADRVFFCNSGAEANEAALKLARKYAHVALQLDMPYVVTANASFHGRTLATITATGQPKYHRHFEPLMPGFLYTPYNDAAALEELVRKIHAGEVSAPPDAGRVGLAAILLEALQGEGGVRPGDREFFATARRLCDETGALLILDEVQVGVGRTGRMFGFQNLDIEPDVFTLAKGLGGGIPIGAMAACAPYAEVLGPGEHASTFGGNPLACRAGLTVLQALERDGVLQNVQARGAQLRTALQALVSRYPEQVKEARGWGLIQGLELVQPHAPQLVRYAIEEGVLLVPAGPTVVRFVPPLTITERELGEALQAAERALSRLTHASSDA